MKTKRCKSVSEGAFHKRCKKLRGHEVFEMTPTHRNGPVVWHGDPSQPISITFATENRSVDLSGMVSKLEFGGRLPDFLADGPEDPDKVTATPQQQLTEWWIQQAEDEVARTVPKAVEYGATDLVDIGRNIARLADYPVDDQQAALLGVFFYLEGKFARWRSAIHEKRPVSDDTLFDIGVYVRMAQRITEFGSWPGTKEESA